MHKSKRKLKEELHDKKGAQGLENQIPCALQQKLSCCDGIGFRLTTEGAFLKAELCTCVSSCPHCFGKARQLVNGHSRPCREPSPSRVVNLLNTSMIPARYAMARLEQFSNHTGNGLEVSQNIQKWVRGMRERPQGKGLLITGPVGVGKTYILASIAKSFAYQGHSVRFIDFFQLLGDLKAGYSKEQADSTIIQSLINVDLLVIDELGKGRNSDWELSIIDQLVMGRYNQNKPIVATTNYSLRAPPRHAASFNKDLENRSGGFELNEFESLESRVGARIFSRLIETCFLVEMKGQDFRRQAPDGRHKEQFLF